MSAVLEFFVHLRRFIWIVVDRLKEYKVAHRGLGEGVHSFDFDMDEDFFDCFEATKGTTGLVKAKVEIVKSVLLMEVKLRIEGSVKAVCDRCLGEMDLPVKGEMALYVKQGKGDEEDGDSDFILLPQDADYLDLSGPLYELYMLNLPLRVVHPDGECDPEMEHVLEAYAQEKSEKMDPRWEELKKLINNNQ